MEACNLILYRTPLGQLNFKASRDQPQPGFSLRRRSIHSEGPGNEVVELPPDDDVESYST